MSTSRKPSNRLANEGTKPRENQSSKQETTKQPNAQNDGFRYDYDDSSDL
ncbi:hypothetical protein [Alkalihalobacillus sp. BA299]|nr:hypothetical protein [Alkalihalobacillus sp. BA299]